MLPLQPNPACIWISAYLIDNIITYEADKSMHAGRSNKIGNIDFSVCVCVSKCAVNFEHENKLKCQDNPNMPKSDNKMCPQGKYLEPKAIRHVTYWHTKYMQKKIIIDCSENSAKKNTQKIVSYLFIVLNH